MSDSITPMMQNSTEGSPLPFFEPGALDPPSLDENESPEVVGGFKGSGYDAEDDGRIAPVPSQATPTVPDGVDLETSESKLLQATGVIAVMKGATVVAIDTNPPAPVPNVSSSDSTTSSTHTLFPTASSTTTDGLDPSTATTPSCFPLRLPLKVLLPVCLTVVSILWRYSAEQFLNLAKTQPLIVLLIYINQPSHAANSFVTYRAAYMKKHQGLEGVAKLATNAYKKLWEKEKALWAIPGQRREEEKRRSYPGYRYTADGSIAREAAVREAIDSVGLMIEQSAQIGLSQDFIDDITEVLAVARRKLKTSSTNRAAGKRRQGTNGKVPKQPKGKKVVQLNGIAEVAAEQIDTTGHTTSQATCSPANTASTTQAAAKPVNAGTKRKRSSKPTAESRKAVKAEGLTQASRAVATTSTAARSSPLTQLTNNPQTASTSTVLPSPIMTFPAAPSQGPLYHAQTPTYYLPGFDFADQNTQGNRFDQCPVHGADLVSSNTPQSHIITPDSDQLDNNTPFTFGASIDLGYDQASLTQGDGGDNATTQSYDTPVMPSYGVWPLESPASDDTFAPQNGGESILGVDPLPGQGLPVGGLLGELFSSDLRDPFAEWNSNIPVGQGSQTQEIPQYPSPDYSPYGSQNYYGQGDHVDAYGLGSATQDGSYNPLGSNKENYNPAPFGLF